MNNYKKQKTSLVERVGEDGSVEFVFHVLSPDLTDRIKFVIERLMKKYDRPDLIETVFASIIQLSVSAVKTNMRQYYFGINSLLPKNSLELRLGNNLLKRKLNIKTMLNFQKIAWEYNLYVKVVMLVSSTRIVTIVENNAKLTEYEDSCIREDFIAASHYTSLMDYYRTNDHLDDFQRADIALVTFLLKDKGIDPHAFTINTRTDNLTVSKVEFPIKQDTSISRNRKGFV